MEMVLSTKHNPLVISYSVLYCTLLLTCIVLTNSQTVFIPELSEFIEKTKINESTMKGLLVDLLSVDNPLQVQYSIQSIPVRQNTSPTDAEYCISMLSTNKQSLCLFQFSSDILMNMENSSLTYVNNKQINYPLPYITRSFTQLKPVFIIKCYKNNCSKQLDSSFLNEMYFLYTFHSSIWSLILLYTLTTGSLLFVFEYTRPSSEKYTKISPSNEPSLGLWDSYVYVLMGLFLQSSYKLPKSWGGITITLFWHAFCLICIIAYAIGTSVLIFKQYTDNDLKYHPYLNSQNQTIYCDLNPNLCKYFEKRFSFSRKLVNGKISPEEINTSMIILTDHIHGQYLQSLKYRNTDWNYIKLDCKIEDEKDDDENFYDSGNFQDMPLMEMGFLTFSEKSLWEMNVYLKYLQDSGRLYSIKHKNEPAFDFTTKLQMHKNLCVTKEDKNSKIPIRLKQMNGPLLFMIIGCLCAVMMHISEYIYYIVMNR
ncbi:unnamed protein product [Schistosoma rodhaini]|uniref:PBPe domain-containing protein n=2 Tax=Schistosoma rodhaini TaxID=6188 RepID=A0AA85F3R0_9TREM|nr:unnamed protein product [Schistosoma rodhaini]